MLGGMDKTTRRDLRILLGPALCAAAIAGGCGGHGSAVTTVEDGTVPATTVRVFLATTLACEKLGDDDARFTPLVVRGPGYATTLDPYDGCRKQRFVHWWSYAYSVPVPRSGRVRLSPGNQPTATLDAVKLRENYAATIYYVNCADYDTHCPDGQHVRGRMTRIEYFKDDDVMDASN